jgi:hypothetical protein
MKSDIKVKMIFGGEEKDRLRRLEEFKKVNRIISIKKGDAMIIVNYSIGQEQMDDVEVIKDGQYPFRN